MLININPVVEHQILSKKDLQTLKQFDIPNEQMIFGANLDFAFDNGGMITDFVLCKMLENLKFLRFYEEKKHLNINVDTRVTQCMKGYLPSIGGWHMDEVPRCETYSQPDFSKINPEHRHFMFLLSTAENHSCTEFVNECFDFDAPKEKVYNKLDNFVSKKITEGVFSATKIKTGFMYEFDKYSVHRPTPTINPGWRFFMRVSFSDRKNMNKIRKQVQVYIPGQNGW